MPASTFPVGLVPGVVPTKWFRVWAERVRTPALVGVPLEEGEQTVALADGRARMVFARLPLQAAGNLAPADLHVVRLYEEQPVVVVPADHLVTAVDEVELADVAEELLSADDLPPGSSTAQRIAVVAAGQGLLLVPMSVARAHQRKDLAWRPVTDAEPTTVALVWPRTDDDPLCQELVGITRGRTARSSR
ncbi:MAG: LysR family transcriptional regulator [Nocardioides sp.]|nr:LysR family transcriptional regulator [Nocardioides sp.]